MLENFSNSKYNIGNFYGRKGKMNVEILFLAYRPLLYKYLALLFTRDIDFEDFKQEGELALLELLKRYDPQKGDLSSYLKKSLYYALLRIRTRLRYQEEYVEELGEIEIYKEELQEEKIIDFSYLSKREKEIVMLIYFNELSIRKTAKVLGLSPSSVKVYKKRAINKLKFWCKI